MSESIRDKVASVFMVCTLLLIIGGGLFLMYPNFRRAQLLKQKNAELQDQIDRRKAEIELLLENQRRFKTDPDFVEMIARRNRRVFPGELLFTFEKE